MVRFFLWGMLMLFLASCGGEAPRKGVRAAAASKPTPKLQLTSPHNRTRIKNGDSLAIGYRSNGAKYDSVLVSLDGRRIAHMADTSAEVRVEAKRLGERLLKVAAFAAGKEAAAATVSITLLAPGAPKRYGYTVVNAYPHDERAYTQGLLLHRDVLHEGTGIYGRSAVRKVDLKSGEVLQQRALDAKYFGEGICILNGLLYQLTWREQSCLVYSCETLEPLAVLPYSGEGWGLTTDGEYLIMSNGSNVISFVSPADFVVRKRLEVYTDRGAVDLLNELELIDGEIWANVYGADNIVRIDTASGAVTGVVNLQNLLPSNLRDKNTDVLNGIAYNEKTGQIFVTGKCWKRLFEVRIFNF
ncbi:MAG: glutaminyl-peptide cyclotransferase [Prevotellaceae bacterium]|jgi:glutamine cyclotransferase|nr:glutaminyl-peptide cyclotransferase [Prevotellaceae bacterium]